MNAPTPSALPIIAHLGALAAAINTHAVTIVCGATGSGKSTEVPQLCLRAMPGARIGHTQPRRLAARAIATRIASLRHERVGQVVGFQTRFEQQLAATTQLKVMTDGILLQEIAHDPELSAYDIVIIDEVHERSLNIDFILGYLKTLLARRPRLRVILMSATIEAERFKDFFGAAAIVEIPGATYAVDMRYRPLADDDEAASDLSVGVLNAIHELDREQPGDILVFLPGEREINDAADVIRGAHLANTEVLPLYARLSVTEQQRVFTPHPLRHIVLATNVAETSLTVPGIRHVIDSGLARLGSYSPRSKIQRLPIAAIAQASANQRTGRCGRERAGICIRLYAEEDFARRPLFTEPELRRSNLAGVMLRLLELGLGAIDDFPLLDPPSTAAINDGYLLLRELGATTASRMLTAAGRQIAALPLDPRLGRMLLGGAEFDCLREILIIVSALSAGDIRERPPQARQAADAAHAVYRDPRSDFMWYLRAWSNLKSELLPLSRRRQFAHCRAQYWSWRRAREWLDLERELTARVGKLGFKVNAEPATYRAIHQALLTGLVSRVARWEGKADYVGARQQRARLHPSSALRGKPPAWLMAAEITETSSTYAHTAAKIDVSWLVRAAAHLTKHQYTEPQWDLTRGEVFVLESQTLYGLSLFSGRRVALHTLDMARAREWFVRFALVPGALGKTPPFLRHNLGLVAEVKAAEERARRRDLLADEAALENFYLERLPTVATRRELLAWLRADPARDHDLRMRIEWVTRDGISQITEYLYPSVLNVGELKLPLTYRFAPNATDDGVSVILPVALVERLDVAVLARLVPGLLAEKVSALIKRLPKAERRALSPLADFAPAITAALERTPGPLAEALSEIAARMTGVAIAPTAWRFNALPAYLQMRVRLLDSTGEEVSTTRDLAAWRAGAPTAALAAFAELAWELSGTSRGTWNFGELPTQVIRPVATIPVVGYPALHAVEDHVSVVVVATPELAHTSHRAGVVRLLQLGLFAELRDLRKIASTLTALELQALRLGWSGGISEALIDAALVSCVAAEPLPREPVAFATLRAAVAQRVTAEFRQQVVLLQAVFNEAVAILTDLAEIQLRWPEAAADITTQIRALCRPGFLAQEAARLPHYPRYLRAIRIRLERLQIDPTKDAQRRDEFLNLQAQCMAPNGQFTATAAARLQFLLEEFRVALFAPTLRTAEKVSVRRIAEFVACERASAGGHR